MRYLPVLGLTLVVELAVAALFALLRRREDLAWLLLVVLGANLASHGLFYLSFLRLPGSYWPKLIVLELVIGLAEAGLYWGLARLRPFEALALSAAANLASLVAGLLLL